MTKILLLPQEIETFYILPSLRCNLALVMKKQGMKQKDVASLLGINSATISQYTSKKRGNAVSFPQEVVAEIEKSAMKIKDRFSYLQETQRLLRHIRLTNVLCQVHKKFSDVPSCCDPTQIGCHPLQQHKK